MISQRWKFLWRGILHDTQDRILYLNVKQFTALYLIKSSIAAKSSSGFSSGI